VEPSASNIALPESVLAGEAVGMAIVDSRGRFTYANQTLRRMSGYDEPELYRMKFREMIHPDDCGEMGRFGKERRLLRKD
jgi:PAS domain S-box-containing protein